MEKLKYVSAEYQERLDRLASMLCERFKPVEEQLEFDLSGYAEIADIIIEKPEIAQLGRTARFGWDSEGRYLEDER